MKTVFSGVQPSGNLHIGNYIGALSQWVKVQENAEAFFCIVDLHAITVPQDPKILKEKILDTTALYLACGINPKKAHIFIQSENPDHTSLAWILNCITSMGQLRRMTQYKEKIGLKTLTKEWVEDLFRKKFDEMRKKKNKSLLQDLAPKIKNYYDIEDDIKKNSEIIALETEKRFEENSLVGLFDYPVLMAADILLYQTDEVPVGEDQRQHIELTRDLAEKFNKKYGEVFKLPAPLIQKETAKIMSLQNPTSKMSKSDKDPWGTINLLDNEKEIREKVKRAVTDSDSVISFGLDKPAISNLLTIYCVLSGESPIEAGMTFRGKNYSEFKNILADVIVRKLSEIQKKYQEIRGNNIQLRQILDEGRDFARAKSTKTLQSVREKMGLI